MKDKRMEGEHPLDSLNALWMLWMPCECLMNALWMPCECIVYIQFRINNNFMFYKITVQDESSGWLLPRFTCTRFNRFMMEILWWKYYVRII